LFILGLDPSLTRTGVALPNGEALALRPKDKGLDRLLWIRKEIGILIGSVDSLDFVCIEGFSYGSKGKAVFEIAGLGYMLRLMMYENSIPFLEVSPSSLKKYATGHGNANKTEVIRAAWKRLGYEGTDDNEADALWLRAIGLDYAGDPILAMPEVNRSILEGLSLQ